MNNIKSLKEIGFNQIFEAFEEAFKDYEMQLNKTQLKSMLKRRGYVPELSFGAFNDDKLVSFTLNGVDLYNGIKTAYDTGTGTIKEFRGKGLASNIFQYSLPYLKEVGINQYLLEVLQHNKPAISIYKKQGFKVSREFNYFVQENKNVNIYKKDSPIDYQIKNIDIEQIKPLISFHDFYPSWQNSFESTIRSKNDFKTLGLMTDNKLVGYCVFEPSSGDITQIGIDKNYRRKGLGSILLEEMLNNNNNDSIKIINTDTNCNSITKFLQSNSINISGKQFEMIKQL